MKHAYACGECGAIRDLTMPLDPLPARIRTVTELALAAVRNPQTDVPSLLALGQSLQQLALECADAELPTPRAHPAWRCRDQLAVTWPLLMSCAWSRCAVNAAQGRTVHAPDPLSRLVSNETIAYLEQLEICTQLWDAALVRAAEVPL